jgi:proton glutamate symport protein
MPHPRLALLALILGLGGGSLIAAAPSPGLLTLVAWVEPVGTLWIAALRMVVVPLVISLLVVGVSSLADLGAIRRIGATSFAVWVLLLLVSASLGLLLVPFLFSWLTIDPAASTALRASAASMATATSEGLERMPSYSQWLIDLVPTNPIRAAADGSMLPLVVFSLALGLAATRLRQEQRTALLGFFDAAADAMLVIVRWVLRFTPAGVFALSIGVASRIGIDAAGAIGYYLAVVVVTMAALAAALFVIAAAVGRVPPWTLARALLPAQVVGFTSRSSLASLPAQVDAAATQLRLPQHATGFVLPLAVASFKPHGPVNWSSLAVFSALLYGVPIGPAEVLTVVVAAVLLSFAVPGIPSAGMLLIAPVFADIGVPVEAIGILIAVDAIPDMFKTVANVTGQMSSAVIVSRFTGGAPPVAAGVDDVHGSEAPVSTGTVTTG